MSDKLDIPSTSNSIEVITVDRIVKDGVEYKPSYSTDGLKIPMVIPKITENQSSAAYVFYMEIPRDILKNIMSDLIPEFINQNHQFIKPILEELMEEYKNG